MVMRNLFLTFGFLVFFTFIYGQDNRLIYSKQVSDATRKTNEILQKSKEFVSVDFVGIELEKILDNEEFILQFGNKSTTIVKKRLEVRGIRNFCFSGKSETDGTDIVITVLDDVLLGTLSMSDAVYSIEMVENNEYAIILLDLSGLKEDCEDLLMEGEQEDDELDNVPKNKNVINNDINDTENIHFINSQNNETQEPFSLLNGKSSSDCKIRVLVLYTSSAESYNSNIKASIQHAVDLTNESFANSDIYYRMELAYAGKTNYTESNNHRRDLRRFRNQSDGYMDEVHTLRNKYAADVCVLVCYDVDYPCGRAFRIGASIDNAFCMVDASSCLTANYSFGHEIGHLLGCRHDMSSDALITPYAYAHGYINPSKTWRTIMAYPDPCNSCQRIKYWSNPDVYYYTGEVMGTSSRCNNARVWNMYSTDFMAFRQPDNNVIFTNSDFNNGTYGDVVAKQTITTSETVNVSSGSTLHMRAGNSIRLLPGFKAEAGSVFSAKIENIDDCSTKGNTQKILVQTMQEEDDTMIEESSKVVDFLYKVYPNPSNEFINIQYCLNTEMLLSIELVNILGQSVKTILPKQNQQTGTHTLQIPVSDFSIGTYFLTIRSTNQTKTEKIIINK